MARPRSEDKRQAILAAAVQVIAEQGLGAPTARIAKLAGVAEGTLFTYFSTKDDLLNQLYLELKTELREVMMSGYPAHEDTRTRVRHVWRAYVHWGVDVPEKRKALAQLAVSDRVTEQTRAAAAQAFADVNGLIEDAVGHGVLCGQPLAFAGAIMVALAEATMEFMARHPAEAERYGAAGFESFWRAVAEA